MKKMKKTILTLTVTLFIAGNIFTGCSNSPSQTQKVENAEQKVLDAKTDVREAQKDLNAIQNEAEMNYQQFRIVYDNKIMANEKSIAELKVNIADAKEENKVLYQKKLAELERRNNDLRIDLNNSKSEGADEWLKFKNEFKNDMDDLGKAFADFTVTNK